MLVRCGWGYGCILLVRRLEGCESYKWKRAKGNRAIGVGRAREGSEGKKGRGKGQRGGERT